MTTRFPGLRLRQLPVLATLALLASCGGSSGPDAEQLGAAIAEGFICAFTNCKPSAEVSTQDVVLVYRATHSGNQVTVDVHLNQANRWAVLQLSPGDALTAEIGGRPMELKGPTATSPYYSGSLDVSADTPLVKVSFHRAGQAYPSTVTLPQRFAMLSPGGPLQLNSRSADVDVVLQLPGTSRPALRSDATCTLDNGANSSLSTVPSFTLIEASPTTQRYRVTAAELGRVAATAVSTSANTVRNCEFRLTWAQTQTGSNPAGLSSDGTRVGESAVKLTLSYDATR